LDKKLIDTILTVRRSGEPLALATITHTWGHAPREVGAKMLVWRDGRIQGTIGGGCGEDEVRLRALQVLDTGQAVIHIVDLLDDPSQDDGAICGGKMEVFIERLI
jgi:xanthine dehydrogenase accessory factor